jgi:hypothetical protein
VIESHTIIAVEYAGMKASTLLGWILESGPNVIDRYTHTRPSTTATANRCCAGPGGRLDRIMCCSLRKADAICVIRGPPCGRRNCGNGGFELGPTRTSSALRNC